MKKTQYCRIVKSDGTIFSEHFYLPKDLEEVMEEVHKTDPYARVQWLWTQYAQEWREDEVWQQIEGLADFLYHTSTEKDWVNLTNEQKQVYRDLAVKLLAAGNKDASPEVQAS